MRSANKENQKPRPAHFFKKGVSGNPTGRPKSDLNKVLSEYMLKKNDNGKTYTEMLVARVLDLALSRGDMDAIEFIWDRLEGKVAQGVEHTGRMTLEQLVQASITPEAKP